MFIEYCDGGALDSIIVDLEKGLTEKQVGNYTTTLILQQFFDPTTIFHTYVIIITVFQIAFVTREMVEGLAHLHTHRVIHR